MCYPNSNWGYLTLKTKLYVRLSFYCFKNKSPAAAAGRGKIMISTPVMNYLMEIAVISFIIPVALLLICRMWTRKNMMPALIGAAIFLACQIVSIIPNTLLHGVNGPIYSLHSTRFTDWLYIGLMSAILQQLGRYLAFRYFTAKYPERATAAYYGIGHGGVECMLVVGVTYLSDYMNALMLNQGTFQKLGEEKYQSVITALQSLTAKGLILDGLSQLLFLIAQIGLSILVFQAVRNDRLRVRLLCLAVFFHTIAYFPQGLYQQGVISHAVSFVFQILITLFLMIPALDIYKKMGEREKLLAEEEKKRTAKEDAKKWAIASKRLNVLSAEKEEEKNDTKK